MKQPFTNAHWVLRCMYLDLKDLLSIHTSFKKRNRKTPEIKLLEQRIIDVENQFDKSDIVSIRNQFLKNEDKLDPQEELVFTSFVKKLPKLFNFSFFDMKEMKSASVFFLDIAEDNYKTNYPSAYQDLMKS